MRWKWSDAQSIERDGWGYMAAQGPALHTAFGKVFRDLTSLYATAALFVNTTCAQRGQEPLWLGPTTGGRDVYEMEVAGHEDLHFVGAFQPQSGAEVSQGDPSHRAAFVSS